MIHGNNRRQSLFKQLLPGKEKSLFLQICIQAFVDLIEQVVAVNQFLIKTCHGSCTQNLKK